MVMKTKSDKIFVVTNYTIFTIIAFIMIYPFLNVIAISFSTYQDYLKNPMMLFPMNLNFDAFKFVFSNSLIGSSYLNTVYVTVVGALCDIVLIITLAYPLSRSRLRGKKFLMNLIIFTMLFNGGIIPNFYLVQSLGLIDTLPALFLPTLVSAFNVIIMKNFFESIPSSLEESAHIDGANAITLLVKIIIPLSKPAIATVMLFVMVGFWNSYFNAIMYIRSQDKWTLQLLLREIVTQTNTNLLSGSSEVQNIPTENLKYATLLVVILPILTIYPFLQKYFVNGVMVGAVKG